MFTLEKLRSILNSPKVAVLFFGLAILMIVEIYLASLLLSVFILLGILFTPYMLYVLFIHGKTDWFYGFFIWMGTGFLIRYMIGGESETVIYISDGIPFLFYLLYCFFLNQKVGEWVIDQPLGR
ncbi:MAG: hypothetical protein WEA58_04750 [Balneolaceae bacterium]